MLCSCLWFGYRCRCGAARHAARDSRAHRVRRVSASSLINTDVSVGFVRLTRSIRAAAFFTLLSPSIKFSHLLSFRLLLSSPTCDISHVVVVSCACAYRSAPLPSHSVISRSSCKSSGVLYGYSLVC